MEQQNKESIQNAVNTANPLAQPVKQNNTLVIILSVLLLISISISSYFAYQTQTLVKELNSLKTNTEKVEPTPVSSTDLTIDWKTFTSKNYLFSFKYPNNWILNSPSPDDSFENSGLLDMHVLEDAPVSISLQVVPKIGTSFELQSESIKNYGWKELYESQLFVDGTKATIYSGILDNKPRRIAVFSSEMYIYIFGTVVFDDLQIINDILSTFKFTN